MDNPSNSWIQHQNNSEDGLVTKEQPKPPKRKPKINRPPPPPTDLPATSKSIDNLAYDKTPVHKLSGGLRKFPSFPNILRVFESNDKSKEVRRATEEKISNEKESLLTEKYGSNEYLAETKDNSGVSETEKTEKAAKHFKLKTSIAKLFNKKPKTAKQISKKEAESQLHTAAKRKSSEDIFSLANEQQVKKRIVEPTCHVDLVEQTAKLTLNAPNQSGSVQKCHQNRQDQTFAPSTANTQNKLDQNVQNTYQPITGAAHIQNKVERKKKDQEHPSHLLIQDQNPVTINEKPTKTTDCTLEPKQHQPISNEHQLEKVSNKKCFTNDLQLALEKIGNEKRANDVNPSCTNNQELTTHLNIDATQSETNRKISNSSKGREENQSKSDSTLAGKIGKLIVCGQGQSVSEQPSEGREKTDLEVYKIATSEEKLKSQLNHEMLEKLAQKSAVAEMKSQIAPNKANCNAEASETKNNSEQNEEQKIRLHAKDQYLENVLKSGQNKENSEKCTPIIIQQEKESKTKQAPKDMDKIGENIVMVETPENPTASESSKSELTHNQAENRVKTIETDINAEVYKEMLFVQKAYENISCIRKEIQEIEKEINIFTGTSADDQDYLYMDEVVVRSLIKLDNVETRGNKKVRTERKQAIQDAQQLLKKLDEKLKENVNKEKKEEKVMKDNDIGKSCKVEMNKSSFNKEYEVINDEASGSKLNKSDTRPEENISNKENDTNDDKSGKHDDKSKLNEKELNTSSVKLQKNISDETLDTKNDSTENSDYVKEKTRENVNKDELNKEIKTNNSETEKLEDNTANNEENISDCITRLESLIF